MKLSPQKPPQKACDQCYRRKKRCCMPRDASRCARCEKASLSCTVVRPPPRSGRPPNRGLRGVTASSLDIWDYTHPTSSSPNDTIVVNSSTESSVTLGSPQSLPESPGSCLESRKTHLPLPFTVEEFYATNDIYMFGASFATDFYQALDDCHQHSSELLQEIFVAIDSLISYARFNRRTFEQIDIKGGAVSVGKLRNAVISHAHDALGVLMLGQTLAAFDSLLLSTASNSILRCALSLAKPWYASIAPIERWQPITIAPVFWDILWCLLHCEVPVVRPVFSHPEVVDRVAGLCTSLLPVLYDLCVVSHEIRCGSKLDGEEALDAIHARISSWQPDESKLHNGPYSELEIASMHAQAVMYRAAGLLLVHRLRHPFSPHDPTAISLANEILDARTRFFARSGAQAKLQNTTFPLTLALLEIHLPAEEVWESATKLRIRPACVDRLFEFNTYLWQRRHSGFMGSLFDLVESGPAFVPVP